jgi:hypothetical protein
LKDVIVTGGSSDYGGGLELASGMLEISGSKISGNKASGSAGGIHISAGKISIDSSDISDNSCNYDGGSRIL